ncbi:hypothetical protein GINT2_000018 [Glugoides intestinalis]
MHLTSILIASTLISCNISKEEELKKLKELEEIYKTIPMNETELGVFVERIDSILNSVPLKDQKVFNKFAPFLLHSVNHNEKLKDMDLRLVYETKNENLKKHWIDHAVQKVKSLRFSFNIDEINNVKISEELEFFNKFSKHPKVELSCSRRSSFKNSVIWNNLMEILSLITKGPEIELLLFDSVMLKDFIDGAVSNLDVLLRLNKLKIVFDDESGIRYLNSAVENFPSLFKSLSNLSEITIENQADRYTPREGHESDNLVKLLKELPENRDIKINLIGRFVESEIFNALKETPEKVEVSIVYKLYSFDKFRAGILRDKIEDPKLNIKIFSTRNGTERHLPITTENLENLFKAKDFFFSFGSRQEIEFDHTNMNDFLSSFGPFFQEREWDLVIYRDKKPRTEICELPEFVKAFNTSESIRFRSNFLDISNENDTNDFISVVNRRNKRLLLYASEILIDSENLITIYNKMQEKENFTVEAKSWLITVRKGKVGAFKDKFKQIYKTLYPEGLYQNEFLDKIEALSKISELDVFTINLSNKDVLYIGDEKSDPFLQVLPTIKNMFEKVFVTEDNNIDAFQIHELRKQLRNGGSCTQEKGTEEFLLPPQLTSQSITNKSYLIRLFLWLKNIFAIISSWLVRSIRG